MSKQLPGSQENPLRLSEWYDQAEKRYGKNASAWRFRCPVCKTPQSVNEFPVLREHTDMIAFSCVGRLLPKKRDALSKQKGRGPCNYAGGGLFRLNPIHIRFDDGTIHTAFDFADNPLVAELPEKESADA